MPKISGIGTDIVEIERIRGAVKKWGEKFLKRVFSEKELAYCFAKHDPFPHLAARFAAKEAVVKALSGSESGHIAFKDIEVSNEPSGKPCISINEKLKSSIAEKTILHLTLSHERSHAVASVIIEKEQ